MIRPARREDARPLAELEVRAWRWAYVDIVAERDMPSVDEREARWREESLDGAAVWEQGGRVVGVVETGPRSDDPAVGALRALYVDPAAQGAGIGGALHDHGLAELRAAGFAEATLWVFSANGHARDLYVRRGWRPDGTAGEWRGVPELRYHRELQERGPLLGPPRNEPPGRGFAERGPLPGRSETSPPGEASPSCSSR